MLVNVSVPARVESVPEVGNVTPVVLVAVRVIAYAPAVIRLPPSTMVKVAPAAGAVIVTLFTVVAVATPILGVVSVGDVAKTNTPVPVSSEIIPAN